MKFWGQDDPLEIKLFPTPPFWEFWNGYENYSGIFTS